MNDLEFSVERLESRKLLAGDVDVVLTSHGDLRITGDNHDNSLEIRTEGFGSLKRFIISPTATTTINGQSLDVVIGHDDLRDLKINMKGGNDSLGIYVGSGSRQFRHGSIKMGGGEDNLFLFTTVGNGVGSVNFSANLKILLGAGANTCDLDNAHVGGNATVIGGNRVDSVEIADTEVDGKTTVKLKGDEDNLYSSSVVLHGPTDVRLGSGRDYCAVEDVATESNYIVHGGQGYDTYQEFGANSHLVLPSFPAVENFL